MDKSLLGWILLLGLGFPLLGILLGELAERLERHKHPLAIALRMIRQYVLPPLALLLVMRVLLDIADENSASRIVETVTWGAIILAGIALINALLTTKAEHRKGQIQVPNLFFQLARTGVILAIGYYLVEGVWHIDLSGLVTALGVGSLVIALALQDTLSNLVSGLLLLIASPFKVGDWIEFNGIEGRVIEQNWWSVTLQATMGRRITVPNGSLSKATVVNYGKEGIWKNISAGFSYDDPPNQVIPALNSMVEGINGLESEGFAGISSYGDSGINYDLWYKVQPDKNWGVAMQLTPRIYYVAKRHGFTIPYPIEVQYNVDTRDGLPNEIPQVLEDRKPEVVTYLRSLPYFFSIDDRDIEKLANRAKFKTYGAGELITQEGKPDEGLYLVYEGTVHTSIKDNLGNSQRSDTLGIGEAFGEMALYPGEVSPITAIANEDVEILVISPEEVVELIQSNPNFSSEIVSFIEERRKAVLLAKGIEYDTTQTTNNNNGRRLRLGR